MSDDSNGEERLAALLRAVAEMADGTHGGLLWSGLADVFGDPATAELVALRSAPDDAAAAEGLARTITARSSADEVFRAAFAAWRGQQRVQAIERVVGAPPDPAPPSPRRAAVLTFARQARHHLAGPWGLTVIGGIVATVVSGLLLNAFISSPADTAVGAAAGGPTASSHPAGPPVVVNDVQVIDNPFSHGTVLPDAVTLSPAQLTQVSQRNGEDFAALVKEHHGVPVDASLVSVAVTGNADQPVRIVDLKVVNRNCTAPLAGTYFFIGGPQGQGPVIPISFDLDMREPVALTSDGHGYFAAHTISLAPGEQVTLAFTSVTKQSYCRYELQLVVLVGSKRMTQTVNDGGKPFEVLTYQPFEKYTKLYVGGLRHQDADPSRTGSFIAADPATYRGEVIKS